MERRRASGTVILGLGNLLLGDEGVGVHAAHLLQRLDLPLDVEVIDGGTGGFELIGHVSGASKVIVIDCVKMNGPPGALLRLTLDDLLLDGPPASAHDGGVRDLLRHIRALSPSPEVTIFGVVPAEMESVRLSLSAAVESALLTIVSAVVEETRQPV